MAKVKCILWSCSNEADTDGPYGGCCSLNCSVKYKGSDKHVPADPDIDEHLAEVVRASEEYPSIERVERELGDDPVVEADK